MSGRKVGQKVFDWTRITALTPKEIKAEVNTFRARHEACKASLLAYREKPEPIDWNYYTKNIAKSNLVENFKKQYEALLVPYPKDLSTPKIEQEQKRIEVEVKNEVQEAKIRAAEFHEKLAELNAKKPLEEMSVDEYLDEHPEIRKKADQDTLNQKWYLGWW